MDRAAYVADAARWTHELVRIERENGNPDPLATLAHRVRASKGSIWGLLYKPPKSVAADVYFALGALYARECERQAERYAAERAGAEAKTRLGEALLRTADRLAGQTGRRP